MRAFEIFVNGVQICTAGVEGYSVLTTILTSHVVDPNSATAQLMSDDEAEDPLELSIGGLDVVKKENLQWESIRINIGDEITIKVVEANSVDPPATRNRLNEQI